MVAPWVVFLNQLRDAVKLLYMYIYMHAFVGPLEVLLNRFYHLHYKEIQVTLTLRDRKDASMTEPTNV